jgi:hypothetical protein
VLKSCLGGETKREFKREARLSARLDVQDVTVAIHKSHESLAWVQGAQEF